MKGMNTFLHKLLGTIWLIIFGIVYTDAGTLSTFGYDRNIQGQIEYDDGSCKGIFGYDRAAIRITSEYTDHSVNDRPVFALLSEFLAAEGGTAALQPMADAAFQTGTIRNVAGYELGGNAGLVGNTYNVNLWGLYATENAQGPFALVNALNAEASAAGASQISITGNAVVKAGRLGFQFQQINPTTILLQGAVH